MGCHWGLSDQTLYVQEQDHLLYFDSRFVVEFFLVLLLVNLFTTRLKSSMNNQCINKYNIIIIGS